MSRIEVWLSLVEHYVRDVGAASSNLVTSTIGNARSFGRFSRCCVFCFIWGNLEFVRHLCADVSKAHEKAGQNTTRNRRRSYCTSGRFSFYACSLSSSYSMRSPGWQCSTLQSLAIERWSSPPVPCRSAVSVPCPSSFSFLMRVVFQPCSFSSWKSLSYLIGIVSTSFPWSRYAFLLCLPLHNTL